MDGYGESEYIRIKQVEVETLRQELADLKKLANKYFELKQQPVEPYWKYIHSELARVTNELQQACTFANTDSKEEDKK